MNAFGSLLLASVLLKPPEIVRVRFTSGVTVEASKNDV